MGVFIYTATESLVGGSIGDTVVLEIGVQESRRARRVEKSVQRSDGGAMEVLKHRAEVTWSVTLQPVPGREMPRIRQFLDSTEAGEAFTMDLYGNASAPKAVKRVDEGYQEESFIRVGRETEDWFVVSFEAIEL